LSKKRFIKKGGPYGNGYIITGQKISYKGRGRRISEFIVDEIQIKISNIYFF